MSEPHEQIQQQPPSAPPPPPQTADLPMAPPVPASAYGQPDTRAVPAGMYLDEASGLALPEGVQLASVGRRIGAYFLAIPLSIITLGIGYIIWGLIVWARGQTPALQVLGMRCWRTDDNNIPGWWWMALREVVGRFLEGILSVISLLVSFILMCSRPDRRCIHDLIAGTVVLYDPNKVLSPPGQSAS
jgi:uncharacterized RDD family membrane protein YckC